MKLLLDRREEAVEVDVDVREEVGLSRGAHRRIIFAECSLVWVVRDVAMVRAQG
jgi:hypothetical protein